MKNLEQIKSAGRVTIINEGIDGFAGLVQYATAKKPMVVIASWGGGWDHISVSYSNRCPTWDEMCFVKDLFFNKDEMAIQYHPVEKDYVNLHPYCLHIWNPQNADVPTPDKAMLA